MMPSPPIAFKEWSMICTALATGRQSLILRKGGIAEGRAGFEWKYSRFALFPTLYHEQENFLVPDALIDENTPIPGLHRISLTATLVSHHLLTDWDQILALAPYHLWTEATVRARFDYTGERALSVGILRVEKLHAPFSFDDEPKYGGCRSWVQIPDGPSQPNPTPVLSDTAHAALLHTLSPLLHHG